MSIGGIGSTLSFWQEDQNYWQQARQADNAIAATTSVINAISNAETNLGKGLASIANGTALNRVNSQITALVEQLLHPSGSTGSSSSGSGGAASSASAKGASGPSPATGTGTVVLRTSTPLSTLGILAGGTITVGTGANTTTYTSTGTDTVADLLNAINLNLPTNANVTASLNAQGRLVITSRDTKSAIFIGGSGNDAAAIGFGVGNNTFLAKSGSGSSSASNGSTGSTAASAGASSSGSSKAASNTGKTTQSYTTVAAVTARTAASLLSDSGVGGTLVDMLA